MAWSRRILACVVALPLMATATAHAADMGNRLVAGGASTVKTEALRAAPLGETRIPLLSNGGFSLGGIADAPASAASLSLPFSSGRGNLAVGGYVAYGMKEARLSSSLRSDGATTRADISAAYAGGMLGADSTAALSLGTAWAKPQGFSPNPAQTGSAWANPYSTGNDLNLSLSLMHQVTPAFSLGGVAQASRFGAADEPASGFMLGAGLGYKF